MAKYSFVKLDRVKVVVYMSRRGMGLAELSEKSGVSVRTIYRLLSGKSVRLGTAYKIAAALDVPADLLLAEVGQDA